MTFQKICTTAGFAVFDDVLSESDHQLVWNHLQDERWEFVHKARWIKEFRLSDGVPLWGPTYLSDPLENDDKTPFYPIGNALDLVIEAVRTHALKCATLIGRQHTDWDYFFAKPYLYPAGTGLSWHRDDEEKAPGAFIYYAHPFWDPQWGGELLLAPLKTREMSFPESALYGGVSKILGSHLEHDHEREALLEEGFGTYILPKPNRLVFITSGALHCIKKVEASAGDRVRATVQGFFQDPQGRVKERRKAPQRI